MILIPKTLAANLSLIALSIVGVIIFLWGEAVARENTTENYKLTDKNHEVEHLRRENKNLLIENKKLREEKDALHNKFLRIIILLKE